MKTDWLVIIIMLDMDQVSLLQQHSPVLEVDLVPGNPGGGVMTCLSNNFGIQHRPETVLGQDLTGVRVGQQGHPLLLDKHTQLLRHHTAALEIHLVMDRYNFWLCQEP